jgi:hypothetical protein
MPRGFWTYAGGFTDSRPQLLGPVLGLGQIQKVKPISKKSPLITLLG